MQATSAELHQADHESGPPVESARFGLWLFLGSEALLFAGLIGSYLFLRTRSRSFGDSGGEVERPFTGFKTRGLLACPYTLARAGQGRGHRARGRWPGGEPLRGGALPLLVRE